MKFSFAEIIGRIVAALPVFSLSAPSSARDDSSSALEEITVTAQFREQSAQDTPLVIMAIWTKDVSAMHRMASRLKAGTVWSNCHAMIDSALPFGGYKQSDIGREHGRQSIEAYTELKSVIIQL